MKYNYHPANYHETYSCLLFLDKCLRKSSIKLHENPTDDLLADPASINRLTQGRGLHKRRDSHFLRTPEKTIYIMAVVKEVHFTLKYL